MINTTNLNQVKKQIQQLKKDKKQVIIQAQDENFNRKILENPDTDILLSPELHERKDYIKQRDSGLNEILCKLAKKNNVKIGVDLKELTKLPLKEKAKTFARIIQNIKLCKRTKTKIIILPKNNYKKQDIISFFLASGASTSQAKQASEF